MTITPTHHADNPKGYTLRTDKLQANMTPSEFIQLENEAQSYEAIMTKGEQVWTEDSAQAGILPRGKRPVS